MKTVSKVLIAAALLIPAGGLAAFAEGPAWGQHQGHPGPGMMGPGMMGPGMMGQGGPGEFVRFLHLIGLDPATHEGPFTKDEILKAAADAYGKADEKHDGSVTLDEFITFWVAQNRELIVRDFQRVDTDGNGKITPVEAQAAAQKLAIAVSHFGHRGPGEGWHHGHHHGPAEDGADEQGAGAPPPPAPQQ